MFSGLSFSKSLFSAFIVRFLLNRKTPLINPSGSTHYCIKRFQHKNVLESFNQLSDSSESELSLNLHNLLLQHFWWFSDVSLEILLRKKGGIGVFSRSKWCFLATKSRKECFFSFCFRWQPEGIQAALVSVKIPAFLCFNFLQLIEKPACTYFFKVLFLKRFYHIYERTKVQTRLSQIQKSSCFFSTHIWKALR